VGFGDLAGYLQHLENRGRRELFWWLGSWRDNGQDYAATNLAHSSHFYVSFSGVHDLVFIFFCLTAVSLGNPDCFLSSSGKMGLAKCNCKKAERGYLNRLVSQRIASILKAFIDEALVFLRR
jgi:hypothetical protein